MNKLLSDICEKNGLTLKLIERIIEIEKNNVYKKRRNNIFGDLKELVDNAVKTEDNPNDHK